jgi:hypothetical protein
VSIWRELLKSAAFSIVNAVGDAGARAAVETVKNKITPPKPTPEPPKPTPEPPKPIEGIW